MAILVIVFKLENLPVHQVDYFIPPNFAEVASMQLIMEVVMELNFSVDLVVLVLFRHSTKQRH